MAYDPMQGFQIGQAIGKSKKSSLGRTASYMSDLAAQRDKERTKTSPLELLAYKNMFPSAKEQSQTEMNEAITKSLSGQSDTSDISTVAKESGYSEQDYILKPVINRFKGTTRVENVPELKPPLDPSSTNELGQFRSTANNLKNNLTMMNQPGVKERMGPLLSGKYTASRAPGSSAFLGMESMVSQGARNFSTFKAETDKVFQQFRKATTGAQAALKELGWLEPDYPMPSDPPELYTQKANEAIKRIEEGENLLLDLYSSRGFRVGEMRKNPLQQGIENAQPQAQEQQQSDPTDSLLNKWKSKYGSR